MTTWTRLFNTTIVRTCETACILDQLEDALAVAHSSTSFGENIVVSKTNCGNVSSFIMFRSATMLNLPLKKSKMMASGYLTSSKRDKNLKSNLALGCPCIRISGSIFEQQATTTKPRRFLTLQLSKNILLGQLHGQVILVHVI